MSNAAPPRIQPSIAERLRLFSSNAFGVTIKSEQQKFMIEAADRIEELEAALREISDLYVNAPGWAAPEPSHEREYKMHQIARAALPQSRDVARAPTNPKESI